MFYKHFTAATAAIVMTFATFAGIDSYAGTVVQDGRTAASLQTATAAQIECTLELALQQTQREVRDNIAGSALSLAPTINVEPVLLQLAHR